MRTVTQKEIAEGRNDGMMSRMKILLVFLMFISTVTLPFFRYWAVWLGWTMKPSSMKCSSDFLNSWRSSLASADVAMATGKPKHTSIVFLKTHKTGSSTVQSILFNFAERHNLTVALPVPACGHQFCYPRSFSSLFVHPYTTPPHVLASHTRFNVTELRQLMPNDTRYITILREPVAMFESLFSYFSHVSEGFMRVPNASLHEFLRQPDLYYRANDTNSMYSRNTVTFDLGWDKDHTPGDIVYAQQLVEHVDSVFSLVMIMEHFDESLILLRHLMNWELEDVLYLAQNMRTEESRQRLPADLALKARDWNWLDAALFDHFNTTLWRRLEALGLDVVKQEVRLLRRARTLLVCKCFGRIVAPVRAAAEIRNKKLRPWQPNAMAPIVGYELPDNGNHDPRRQGVGGTGVRDGEKREGEEEGGMTKDMCMRMITPEVSHSTLLLQSQVQKYKREHPNVANITFYSPFPSPSPKPKPTTMQRYLRNYLKYRKVKGKRRQKVPGGGPLGVDTHVLG